MSTDGILKMMGVVPAECHPDREASIAGWCEQCLAEGRGTRQISAEERARVVANAFAEDADSTEPIVRPTTDANGTKTRSKMKFVGVIDGRKVFERAEKSTSSLPLRFAAVPKEITLNEELTWQAKQVAQALASLVNTGHNPTHKATLSDDDLARLMGKGIGARSARTGRTELVNAGLLESTKAGHAGNVLRFPARMFLPDA